MFDQNSHPWCLLRLTSIAAGFVTIGMTSPLEQKRKDGRKGDTPEALMRFHPR